MRPTSARAPAPTASPRSWPASCAESRLERATSRRTAWAEPTAPQTSIRPWGSSAARAPQRATRRSPAMEMPSVPRTRTCARSTRAVATPECGTPARQMPERPRPLRTAAAVPHAARPLLSGLHWLSSCRSGVGDVGRTERAERSASSMRPPDRRRCAKRESGRVCHAAGRAAPKERAVHRASETK